MNSTIFINKPPKFLGRSDFNKLIQKYFLGEWEQFYQFSLKSKTTEGNSAAIYFP